MQNQGLCKIASGALYANEFPTIFPHVQPCVVNGSLELNLEPTCIQRAEYIKNYVLSEHPYAIALGSISSCILAASNWYWIPGALAIAAPVFALYKQWGHQVIPSTHSYKPIQCSLEQDEFVKNLLVKSNPKEIKLVQDLDLAFRNYRLGVLQASQLEKKIQSLIKKGMENSEYSFSTLSKMDHLFEAGKKARSKIHGKNIVAFLGPTGCGKTTTGNYLCGCNIKEVDSNYLREPDRKVIIAESCKRDIGHKRGEGSSETFKPQLFTDKENGMTYCDFAGIGDTRAKSISFCNSLSMVEILKNAKTIQGLLFFIENTDKGSRYESIKKYIKIMQVLLGDFEPYKKSILFVVTKAKKNSLEAVQKSFKKNLITIIKNDDDEDKELKDFCTKILDSNIWKERMIICDPLSNEQGRRSMIQEIQKLAPLDPQGREFGCPLTSDDNWILDKIKIKIKAEIKQALLQLKKSIESQWTEEIKNANTFDEYRSLFKKMDCGALSFENIITNGSFSQFEHLLKILKNGIEFWDKANKLSPDKMIIKDEFKNECQEIELEIKLLKYKCFLGSFKITLESYAIQKNINSRRGHLKNHGDTIDELISIIHSVMKDAAADIFYKNQLNVEIKEIEAKSPSEIFNLIQLINDYIRTPFTREIKGKYLTISCRGNKISLNQLLEEINRQRLLNEKNKLIIIGQGILYFDVDLDFKKLDIILKCNIEIMHKCSIYLDRAPLYFYSFTLEGKGKNGTWEVINEKIVLNPFRDKEIQGINYTFVIP